LKNLKALHLILIGSFGIYILTLLFILTLYFFDVGIAFETIFLVPVFAAFTAFTIFYILIKQFINERLKLVYRSIRKGKITKENDMDFSFKKDLIKDAEIETKIWLDERQQEISKLKDQEAFRREFLGNLAHELKTPVFSIQGYLLTLLEGGLEDEKVNRMFLERASKATDRMTDLLEDLDHITKLEVDGLPIEQKPFLINELIKEMFESFEVKAKEKNMTMKFAKTYEPIYAMGDRSKLAQVFTNLIGNSISYGNEGGETVIRLYSLDDIITIEVSDNGPGISEDSIPRLFERFYRVEKSRNRHDGGSGLGLAIGKHIIEAHGHTISVRSTVAVGSTFIFTLDKAMKGF